MTWALANTNTIANGTTTIAASLTITLPNAVTAGNLIVVAITSEVISGASVASNVVNDNKGNGTYSLAVFENNSGTGVYSTAIYYKVVATGGSGFAITITPNVSAYISAVAGEFSFTGTGTVTVDVSTSSSALAGGPTQSVGNLTISNTDLVVAVAHPTTGSMTDPAAGFTTLGVILVGATEGCYTDYVLNRSSDINPTWTASAGPNQAAAVAFSTSSSGSGSVLTFLDQSHSGGFSDLGM